MNGHMRCPSLQSLPPPPAGRSGWPWTTESAPTPPTRADGSPWPCVSIVTPSYNQGQYLEETIRSVLLQGYPSLEYIVVDGGSSDDSIAVIKKYEPWISYWVTEPDRGQADAINKSLQRCTGEIFQFLNSDDFLAPGAIEAVAAGMRDSDCVAGGVLNFDSKGHQTLFRNGSLRPANFIKRPPGYLYHQPGVWLRTEFVRRLGGFDASLRYKFDWALMIRYVERWPRVTYTSDILANFRLHPHSKTLSEGSEFWEEELAVRERLVHQLIDVEAHAALSRDIQKRHWRRRVDEILTYASDSRSRALRNLFSEAARDPFHRLDRYVLGAARRILFLSV